jgi:alkaline phosphatase D
VHLAVHREYHLGLPRWLGQVLQEQKFFWNRNEPRLQHLDSTMLSPIYILACALPLVQCAWEGNLNYRSPSILHPGLGIDIPKIAKRTVQETRQASYWDANQLNFTHGVASGDPYPNSVILWTRISPQMANDNSNVTVEGTAALYSHETEKYIAASSRRVCVQYRVGTDKSVSNVVNSGTAYTTSDIDFTVKVSADCFSL